MSGLSQSPKVSYVLTFYHMTIPVVNDVGSYPTLETAKAAAGIGKGLYEWIERDNSWLYPSYDLQFYYTIFPEPVKAAG